MRVASRQREREEVLQRMNGQILALTEEYAPADGWCVYGLDREGKEMEALLEPDRIRGYRRNRVHLSARLPRDVPGDALMLRSLKDSKILSAKTVIAEVQKYMDLAGQSPDDELKQMLIESLLDEDPVRRAMADRAAQEYSAELAAALEIARQRAAEVAPPPGGGPGQGPMGGMPPNALPPQAVPPAVGAGPPGGPGNVPGMMAMAGQPVGRPPGGGQ